MLDEIVQILPGCNSLLMMLAAPPEIITHLGVSNSLLKSHTLEILHSLGMHHPREVHYPWEYIVITPGNTPTICEYFINWAGLLSYFRLRVHFDFSLSLLSDVFVLQFCR